MLHVATPLPVPHSPASSLPDILALIDAEKAAWNAFSAACKATDSVEIGREPTEAEEDAFQEAVDIHHGFLGAVLTSLPATSTGLLAIVDHFKLRCVGDMHEPHRGHVEDLLRGVNAYFRSLPTAALFAVPAVAADASLFVLGMELDNVERRSRAWEKETPTNSSEENPHYDKHWRMRERISAIQAQSLVGLAAKARAAEVALSLEDGFTGKGPDSFEGLSRSLIADVVRLAAARPEYVAGARALDPVRPEGARIANGYQGEHVIAEAAARWYVAERDANRSGKSGRSNAEIDALLDEMGRQEGVIRSIAARSLPGLRAKAGVLLALLQEDQKAGLDDIGAMAWSLADDLRRLMPDDPAMAPANERDAKILRLAAVELVLPDPAEDAFTRWLTRCGELNAHSRDESKEGVQEIEWERLNAIEAELYAAPPSIRKTGALLLNELSYVASEVGASVTLNSEMADNKNQTRLIFRLLAGVRPLLSGRLADLAADILDNPDHPLVESALSRTYHGNDLPALPALLEAAE